MALSRRQGALIAVWVAPSALLLLLCWAVYARYRIEVPKLLEPADRAAIAARLRATLDGDATRPAWPPAAAQKLDHRGPVVVTVWHRGKAIARIVAPGDTLGEALDSIDGQLPEQKGVARLNGPEREQARIKVDITVARAPMLREENALAGLARLVFGVDLLPLAALHPGLEGIGVDLGDQSMAVLLPDELIRDRLLTAQKPIKEIPEFSMGVDLAAIDRALAGVAAVSKAQYSESPHHYYRLRMDSFIEPPPEQRPGPPLPLVRGLPPRPELTAANLRAAAIAGGHYLVNHLAPNGRYIYEVDLTTGEGTTPEPGQPYSIPRHAGTTYFLAELYRHTGEEFLREPIERAFAHLQELIDAGGCHATTRRGQPFSCVVDKGRPVASLGSTALTVVALAEYRRATDDPRYDDLAQRLAQFILFMQHSDGSFAHRYYVRQRKRDDKTQLLYFSGEAALALVRMYAVTGDGRYLTAANHALDNLIHWYDFFAGGFLYGQEHWTCIAAEAAWPALKSDHYRKFCSGYAGFLRDQQIRSGDYPDQEDLVGGFGVTPFVLPFNTPAGSQTEATISAYLLGVHHGHPESAIRDQILRTMHYVMGQQIRPESAWDVAPEALGLGAIPSNPIDRKVRIDFVQHTCSAMIRTAELIETPAR